MALFVPENSRVSTLLWVFDYSLVLVNPQQWPLAAPQVSFCGEGDFLLGICGARGEFLLGEKPEGIFVLGVGYVRGNFFLGTCGTEGICCWNVEREIRCPIEGGVRCRIRSQCLAHAGNAGSTLPATRMDGSQQWIKAWNRKTTHRRDENLLFQKPFLGNTGSTTGFQLRICVFLGETAFQYSNTMYFHMHRHLQLFIMDKESCKCIVFLSEKCTGN